MASADQLKALLKSHLEGDDDRFFSVAMQVAAHEAKLGHGKLAEELRTLIDEAKAGVEWIRCCRFPARVGSWQISWKRRTRKPGWERWF